jgi:hypothetical protein
MPGLVGPGNGDGEAEGLELADVVAELAVGVGAGLAPQEAARISLDQVGRTSEWL